MRSVGRTISLVHAVMVFSAVLFAQPSEPTVKEIDALFEKTEALMRTFSYRGVTVHTRVSARKEDLI
jgi:hypothetical protein